MSTGSQVRSPFARRLVRCALLDSHTYEEVEADSSSLAQAFLVVAVAALGGGASAWLETLTWHRAPEASLAALVFEATARALEPVLIWLGGAAFAYMVGSSFFRAPTTKTDYAEVLRTTGFAFGPTWLIALSCLPPSSLGVAVMWAARTWTLVALAVAVRQALDFSSRRAIGTVLVGWSLGWLVMWGAVSVAIQLVGLLRS